MPRLFTFALSPRVLALIALRVLALTSASMAIAQSAGTGPMGQGQGQGSEQHMMPGMPQQPMGPGMHSGMPSASPQGEAQGSGTQKGAPGRTMGAGSLQGETGIDASGDYRQEMQACMQGRTAQDRATCMEEARNARAANRRGALDTPTDSLEANAMARCRELPPSDMAACRARIMGYGNTSGSVAGGGVLRELEIVEMQPGQESVTIAPKGDAPVLVVPAERR